MGVDVMVVVGELVDSDIARAVKELFEKNNKRPKIDMFKSELGEMGYNVLHLSEQTMRGKKIEDIHEVYHGNAYPTDGTLVYQSFF